jgi:hypothetical protein
LIQAAEIHVPPDLLERILEFAGTDMILVGGQALAFWAAYYHTTAPSIAITKDADAIDPSPVAHIKAFVSKKLPRLLKLMSEARRAEVSPGDSALK